MRNNSFTLGVRHLLFFLSVKGERKYLTLFKAVSKQEEYVEEQLKLDFPDIKNFSQFRNDLLGRLMVFFVWIADDPESQLLKERAGINKLIRSGGDDVLALKTLEKAIQKALDYELFGILDGLFIARTTLLLRTDAIKQIEQNAGQLMIQVTDATNKQKVTNLYKSLNRDYYFLVKEYYVRRKDDAKKLIRPLMKESCLSNVIKAETNTGKLFLNRIWYMINLFLGEYEKCKENCEAIELLFEQNPRLIEVYSLAFFENITNLCVIKIHLKDEDGSIFKLIERLSQIKSKDNTVMASDFFGKHICKIDYHAEHEPTQMFGNIQDIKAGLEKYESVLTTENKYVTYYHIGKAYLETGNHKDGEEWLSPIIEKPSKVRRDLQGMARMLHDLLY